MKNTKDIKSSQKESFRRALAYYLALAGKTQSDLCKDLNLNSSTVSEWSTGKRTPRSDRVQILAEYLHAPMDQFLSFKDPVTVNSIEELIKAIKEDETFREFVKIAHKLSTEDLYLLRSLALKLIT